MDQDKIWVTVRKRPLTRKERRKKDYDTISWIDDKRLVVRERKRKLDLTKYIETHPFRFDQVYSENTTNSQIYSHAVQPLVKAAFTGTKVTWFAYGQTGSGKTYTMLGEAKHPGLYLYAANDIFSTISKKRKNLVVQVSFYEIYCGKLYDLLHKRQELVMREDASQTVNIVGLKQRRVNSVEQLMGLIELGQSVRASGTTGANDDSSRSHAVLQIQLQDGSQLDDVQPGRITFIDLAGSERGADVVD